MKAYEISGSNGTYLELEDGRCADTVNGTGEDLATLRAEATEYVAKPLCTPMSIAELSDYVGA